jgi:hypothetical protein
VLALVCARRPDGEARGEEECEEEDYFSAAHVI